MASESERGCQELGDPPFQKDNINQWTEEGVDLASLFDQGGIRDVDGVKQYLAFLGDSADVDTANSIGQTPLMIACRNGQKDIVKFLLEAGANPNLTCTNLGNTALHYACQGDEDLVLLCRQKPNYPGEKLHRIIEIVDLLTSHRAKLQMNEDGLSPAFVAALNSYKDVVTFFASSNKIAMSLTDKVKAYEMLGVSQAFFDIHHTIDACKSFHIAATLQSEDDSEGTCTPCHITSDLDAWFFDMMKKQNVNRIDKHKVRQKTFTIGIQCVPDQVKDKHNFWDATSRYTDPAFFNGRATEAGYDLLVAMIKKEMLMEYPLGTVLKMMKSVLESPLHHSGSSGMKFVPKLLKIYAEGFQEDRRHLGGKRWETLKLLGGLLFNLAYYQSESKYLEQSLPFVGGIINCIKMCGEEQSQISDNRTLSINSVFFDNMANAMWDDVYSGQSKKTRNRLKFTISRLLYYNGFDPDSDASLLNTLVKIVAVARDRDFIIPLARVLIRYGCPTDDVCIEQADEEYPEVVELLPLLSPPTTPPCLEELATRAVLRNNIYYKEKLPIMLSEKIEGEMYLNPDSSELDSLIESDEDEDCE